MLFGRITSFSTSNTHLSKIDKAASITNNNELQLVQNKTTVAEYNANNKDYTLEMAPLADIAQKMTDNVNIASKLNANELTTVIINAASKVHSIIGSVKSTIAGYASQISMLLNNPFLSDDDINRQIKLLEDKIKATVEEAQFKIMTLYSVSEILMALISTFSALGNTGFNTEEITTSLTQVINGINTKPSDFTGAEDKQDLYNIIDENQDNLFSPAAQSKIDETTTKLDDKIKDCETKLKSKQLNKDEEKQLKLELLIYKAEKRIFTLLGN